MKPVYVIAEAGVNHNGDSDLAFKLVDEAKKAGADAIKFQVFFAKNLVAKSAKKAKYQELNTSLNETQYEMLKKLELSNETHLKLYEYCQKNKINYLATAFDEDSFNFLDKKIKLNTFKIASGEITNGPFLLKHALSGKDLILSTGMSTIKEVESALGIIAYGFLNFHKQLNLPPSKENFNHAFESIEGQSILHKKVTLLH